MPTSLEQQIREAVLHYIAGRVSLRQFQEWFASKTWDSLAETDDVRRLVNEIDLLLAEFSNGHWTEQELKSKLREHRPVVEPMHDVSGVLWSTVRAPYVHFRTNEATGAGLTMNPGTSPPSPSPRIDTSPVTA